MQLQEQFDFLNTVSRHMQQNATELAHSFQQEANEQQQQLIGLIKDQTIQKQTNDTLRQYKQLIEDFKQLYDKLNVSDKFTRIPKLPTCGKNSEVDNQLSNEQKNTVDDLVEFHQTCTQQLDMQKIDDLVVKLERQEMSSQVLVQQIQQLRNDITDFLEEEGITQLPRILQQFLKCNLEENLMDIKCDTFDGSTNNDLSDYKHASLAKELRLINSLLSLLKQNCYDSGNRLKLVYQSLEKQSQRYMQYLLDTIKDGVQDINNNLPQHLKVEINPNNITTQLYKSVIQTAEAFLEEQKDVVAGQVLEIKHEDTPELDGIKLNLLSQRLQHYYDKCERQVDITQTISVVQAQEKPETTTESGTGQLEMSQLGPLALQDQIHQYATQELELKRMHSGLIAYQQYMSRSGDVAQKSLSGCIEQLKQKAEELEARYNRALSVLIEQRKNNSDDALSQSLSTSHFQRGSPGLAQSDEVKKLGEACEQYQQVIEVLEGIFSVEELDQQYQAMAAAQAEARTRLSSRVCQCATGVPALRLYEEEPMRLVRQYRDSLAVRRLVTRCQAQLETLHTRMTRAAYRRLDAAIKSFKQSKNNVSAHLGKLLRQMGVLQGLMQPQHGVSQQISQENAGETSSGVSETKNLYMDVAEQLATHFLGENKLNLTLLKELGNRLHMRVAERLSLIRDQLQVHREVYLERKDEVSEFIESLRQHYNARLESPDYKFLLDTFAQIARARAQHEVKQMTYATFCKFNECAEGFNQMYQEDLFAHQLRLKYLVQHAKENVEGSTENYASQSQYLKTPTSFQKKTQQLTQASVSLHKRLSNGSQGFSHDTAQGGTFGGTGAQSSLNLGVFKNPLISTLHDRNINDLFTSKQKQRMIQIELNQLNERSPFVQMYEKINRFKYVIGGNYDFTELLAQLEKRISQIELLANNAVEQSKYIFSETGKNFSSSKMQLAQQLYSELFDTLTQLKVLSWQGGFDQSSQQDRQALQKQLNTLKQQIQKLQETNIDELELRLNEDIDQMLDEQDQLNKILRTKYLDTAIEEVSEPELIIDQFNNTYHTESQSLRNQQHSYEIENITPVVIDNGPHVIKQVIINDSKQSLNQQPNKKGEFINPGMMSKNLKQTKQTEKYEQQLPNEQNQVHEENIINTNMHPDILKILNREAQVNRLVSQGMMPYRIELINQDVLKLNSVKQGKLTQIKISNIKTVRQRVHTESGVRYFCLDIYLTTTQQVVFAFTNEKLCKAWVQGLRACMSQQRVTE